jgi:hypothetical protein
VERRPSQATHDGESDGAFRTLDSRLKRIEYQLIVNGVSNSLNGQERMRGNFEGNEISQ